MASMSFSSFLAAAIVTQCCFSIIYLSSFRWQGNKWLVLIFSAILSLHIGFLVIDTQLDQSQKLFIGNPGLTLLIWPTMYLYTQTIINTYKRDYKKLFAHFFPALAFYFLFLFVEIVPGDQFANTFSGGDYLPWQVAYFIVFLGTTTFYGISTLRLIQFNKGTYKNEYAETNVFTTLSWLKYFCWFLFAITFVGAAFILVSHFIIQIQFQFWLIEFLFLLCCFIISFFTFRQPMLYAEQNKVPVKTDLLTGDTPKSFYSKEEITELTKRIENLFETEKPYLDSKIRMPEIAGKLNLTSNAFSWVLNEHYRVNFFTFINTYRINYAAELLESGSSENFTLEAISQMAGFRSKTTFNNRFKEIKGVTPSAYRTKPIDS